MSGKNIAFIFFAAALLLLQGGFATAATAAVPDGVCVESYAARSAAPVADDVPSVAPVPSVTPAPAPSAAFSAASVADGASSATALSIVPISSSAPSATAAEPAKSQRIGVVLSGGGAKGLYHIGVLQALEEEEIPIDFIAGTSMGAIIAGLYAAGYSPERMHAIVASGEVKHWVSGRIDDSHRYYFRSMDEMPSAVTLRLNFKGRERGGKLVEIPNGLISTAEIDMALTGLFRAASAAANDDFDRLMVPFRCLASDMNARRGVVFKNGDLGRAIRASMSIPLAFRPMKADSMLLYDGGIFDNFPWRSLEEDFAPDFYIGSKCTAGNKPVDENSGLVDQALMLMMQSTDYSLPDGRGILINRAVDVGMLDFDKSEEIIRSGYEDTKAAMPQIRAAIAVRRSVAEVEKRRSAFLGRVPELLFESCRVEGITAAQKAYVSDFMRFDVAGRRGSAADGIAVRRTEKAGGRNAQGEHTCIDFEHCRDGLFDLLVEDDFTAEYPSIAFNPASGRFDIDLTLKARPSFKVSFGGNISSTAFNQALISARYRTVGRVAQEAFADFYLGVICNTVRAGGRTTFFTKFPVFIDYSYNLGIMNTLRGNFGNLTKIDNTADIKNKENFGSVSLGVALTKKSVLQATVNGGENTYLMNGWRYPSRFVFVASQLEIRRSTLDTQLFPMRGTQLSVSGIYVYGQGKYKYSPETGVVVGEHLSRKEWLGAKVRWEQYFDIPSARWFSVGYRIDGVFTSHPEFDNPQTTVMSSPLYAPIPHSKMIYMPDFHASKYAAAGIMPTFNIIENLMVRAGFYAMFRDRRYVVSRWRYITDLSVVYRTPVGPVSLSLTKYDLSSWHNTYLTFNFGLLIFAPKSLFY